MKLCHKFLFNLFLINIYLKYLISTTVTIRYDFTVGVNYTFVPSAGVSSINIILVGASGGADCSLAYGGNQIAYGGFGAILQAQLKVVPGTVYYLNLGQKGQNRF
jgi:hypothetical protein